jgi:hypothetical protein
MIEVNFWLRVVLDNSFYFTDPVKTVCARINDGREYRGGWCMTQQHKAETDALNSAIPEWEWSRCYEAAGGGWDAHCKY